MSEIPKDIKYQKSHEWLAPTGEGNIQRVGITDHAQAELTDIVFVELPEIGDEVALGDQVAVVESVKAASDIYSPASGKIVAVNSKLSDKPELINESPYDEAWLYAMEVETENTDLLDADAYRKLIDA